jgi:predicted GNAT family acetyltransferase
MIDGMDVTVTENPEAHRYDAVDDGGTVAGFVEYVDHRGTRILFHTEVSDEFEGRGVGSTLAREVLDQAIAGPLEVRVTCPFLTSWIERHPDYAGKVTLG